MTKLPTTLIEAEALPFARDFLARMREGNYFGSALLSPDAGHGLARWWCRLCAEHSPQGADQVVELATEHGERAAHEALVELIDEKTDRNEPLGAVLGGYSIRLRRKDFCAHSGPARTTLIEDVVYFVLMLLLVERFHLKPTRHRDRKHERPSACSVTAQVAAEFGLRRVDEDAFRKLWKRMAEPVLHGFRVKTPKAFAILQRYAAVAPY